MSALVGGAQVASFTKLGFCTNACVCIHIYIYAYPSECGQKQFTVLEAKDEDTSLELCQVGAIPSRCVTKTKRTAVVKNLKGAICRLPIWARLGPSCKKNGTTVCWLKGEMMQIKIAKG